MFCIEPFIIIHSGKPYYMYMYDVDVMYLHVMSLTSF